MVAHRLKTILALSVIFLWLGYHFFGVTKYTSHPWWHTLNSDSDAAYGVTSVGLVNGGEITFLSHPGATIYFFSSIAFRLQALIDTEDRDLFQVNQVKSIDEAVKISGKGVVICRFMVFVSMILLALVIFAASYQLIERVSFAFFITFYLMTTGGFMQHYHMLRPEIYNFIFFFLIIFLSVRTFKKISVSAWTLTRTFVAIGICLGFMLFSKVQSLPHALLLYLLMMIFILQSEFKTPLLNTGTNAAKLSLGVSLFNIMFWPWWAFIRPDYVTPEYLASLTRHHYHKALYGPAPAHMAGGPFLILVILLLLSAWIYILSRNKGSQSLMLKFKTNILVTNLVVAGVLLSIHLILLPVWGGIEAYVENTRRIVYSMMTNVAYGGFLTNKVIEADTFRKIYVTHRANSSIVIFNLLYISLFALIGCGYRSLKDSKRRLSYLAAVLFILLGFVSDIFSTMRFRAYYPTWQLMYSITAYVTGVMIYLACEWDRIKKQSLKTTFAGRCAIIILLVFTLHSAMRIQYIMKMKPTSMVTDQDPRLLFQESIQHGKAFWQVAHQAMKKN